MSNRSAPRNALSSPDVRDVVVSIYALCDPVSGAVRYVGRSSKPEARLSNHEIAGSSAMRSWWRTLRAAGMAPRLVILSEVAPGEDCAAAESAAIRAHAHCDLINGKTGPRRAYWRHRSAPTRAVAALKELGMRQAEIARRVGVGAHLVSRWMSGERKPEPKTRAIFEDALGINWRWWDEPAEAA